jgi:hypothetical protein
MGLQMSWPRKRRRVASEELPALQNWQYYSWMLEGRMLLLLTALLPEKIGAVAVFEEKKGLLTRLVTELDEGRDKAAADSPKAILVEARMAAV